MLLEEWIDIWVGLLDDIEPTTLAKYQYLVEFHILPAFQGHELGSLTFEEIEGWEKAIPTRISSRGTPYAQSVARGARDLLITILGDAVHARKIDYNPAERRKGRRGRVRAKGRAPSRRSDQPKANVITPVQALCLAERCALLSGRDIDFVMNVFAAWTGLRWGELLAVEGWAGEDSPLQLDRCRHLDLCRGLAVARTRRGGLQGTTERRLIPGDRPTALPRHAHAMGRRQPSAFVPLPGGRGPAQVQRR